MTRLTALAVLLLVCLPISGVSTAPLGAAFAAEQGQESSTARVWLNKSSGVYHCPGTRYYGATKRGEYTTEATAQKAGHRPASGRTCQSSQSGSSEEAQQNRGTSTAKVWVNTSSSVYHCPGTRYYGATKRGEYMSQSAAQKAGHRPASGRVCQ